jgi:hypothetical protein
MKKRSPVVIVVGLLCLLVGAAPATAKASLEGEQHIEFNLGFLEGGACEHITWTGEVTLNDVTYDITYEPIGDRGTGRAFHFEEIVRIHPLGAVEVDSGVVTVCPTDSLLWLENSGVGTPNSRGLANGKVQYVAPGGPFDEGLVGHTTHWRGLVSDDALSFAGSFRIN